MKRFRWFFLFIIKHCWSVFSFAGSNDFWRFGLGLATFTQYRTAFRADTKTTAQNRTEQHRTTAQKPGFSTRAGGRRTEFSGDFTWTRRLLFFGNYPDFKRAFMFCHWIKEPKVNDVCVLFKQYNFCSRIPEMHSKMPRFQTFPRNSRVCREFFSFSTYSKAFATQLKSYWKSWSSGTSRSHTSNIVTEQLAL